MSKLKVFLTRPNYPDDGVQLLQEKFEVDFYPHPKSISRDALLEGIKGKDGLFCNSTDRIDKEVIDAAGPQLKIIATMSLGYDHIDLEECRKRNIQVCNGPNPLSVGSVAELTVGLMINVGRRITEASLAIPRGEWSQVWSPEWFVGRGLINATVGIVGMGRIGQAILKRILPFDVAKILYYDICHLVKPAETLGATFATFEDLLQESDFVIATCNLTEQSKGMFNARAFGLMKPDAVFINTSRGAVVEQEDLYEALKSRRIKAAGLDVMYPEPLPRDHKLASLPNVVLLPHIAGSDENAVNTLCLLTAQNIVAVLEGKQPLTPVAS